ncbi:hypothetical protein SO694_00049288 [Aureococcus anophagefferens]|uniref:Uncharacterized protein n=1 Tax=Aureococcus anophagefferens TaxID=44056 RepID=A0ABR1G8I6_AURAN
MAKLLLLGLVASASAFIAPQTSTRGLTVVSVSRPQLKAAKKANRLRPKKSRPSDINRAPPPYNTEPQFYEGRPDEYVRAQRREFARGVVVSEGDDSFDKNAHIASIVSALEAQGEYDNTDAAADAEIMAAVKYPDAAVAAAAMA